MVEIFFFFSFFFQFSCCLEFHFVRKGEGRGGRKKVVLARCVSFMCRRLTTNSIYSVCVGVCVCGGKRIIRARAGEREREIEGGWMEKQFPVCLLGSTS